MNSTQHLARIKLRETERQRNRLHQQYDTIEAAVAQADTPLERLRALHQGLREVTFAQKPLHPEVRELDALYLADELGSVPPELIADRTRLLERELAQGRLRAEFTYAFGRILSEWTTATGEPSPEPEIPADDPFASLWEDPPTLDTAWLRDAFEPLMPFLGSVASQVEKFARTEALAPVKNHEVYVLLEQFGRDTYALPSFRHQAATVLNSETQINEYAGVLTILLNSLEEWEWPEDGLPLRTVWMRIKDRPYLDEDLITALFLQLLGLRWGGQLKPLLLWNALRDGKQPLIPIEPKTSTMRRVAEVRLSKQSGRFLCGIPDDYPGEGYVLHTRDVGYGPYALLALFRTVETEIRFAQAAFPDQPLYIVQADLRNFYPSLSHELIIGVLARLGVPERWRTFFRKFLSARVLYRGETRIVRRGMVLEHVLADVFAECVLLVLDLHVYRTTGVQLLRVVDDFWFITNSHEQAVAVWREVNAFCQACGMEINEKKSGALCLGRDSASLEDLPPERPRWGLLYLHQEGTWQVEESAFGQVEDTIRQQLVDSSSVLALVSRYNDYVNYLLWQLGLTILLRGDHHKRIAQRLQRMHKELFGEEHGLVEEVRRRLSDSFADARLKEQGLPPALLYWPVTAGGLSLAQPMLHVATYLRRRPKETEMKIPDRAVVGAYLVKRKALAPDQSVHESHLMMLLGLRSRVGGLAAPTEEEIAEYLERRSAGDEQALPKEDNIDVVMADLWGEYYNRLVESVSPEGPPKMPVMERLVEDFIQRGSEVSGRQQTDLSPYWRWVVYSYGPSIREALGTFRFLMTELVPLQLILESRGVAGPGEIEGGPDLLGTSEIPF